MATVTRTRPSKPNLNILLLGRTGVGKSTFINCFANYLKFSSLEEIRSKKDVKIPVPCIFELPDENQVPTLFKLGAERNQDGNESLEPLQSQTQGCKSYDFLFQDMSVTLIDTPGIVDTAGVEKDKLNLRNIIEFIAAFRTINAICILLKPDETRLDVILRYWILEILNQFDRSAVDNLIFAYTHSRKTRYGPGPTIRAMEAVFQQIRKDHRDLQNLILSKTNCFYFDSESFHFMVARNDIQFDEIEKLLYTNSWNRARTECVRLINHIKTLPVYDVSGTWSICRARQLIENLQPLLQKIGKTILENEECIRAKQQEVREFDGPVEALREKMFILKKVVKTVHYDAPRFVCHNCATETEIDGVVTKIPGVCYKAEKSIWETVIEAVANLPQENFNPAGISAFPEFAVMAIQFFPTAFYSLWGAGAVALAGMAALGLWYTNGKCNACNCTISYHSPTYYEILEDTERILDAAIQEDYEFALDVQSEKQSYISTLENELKNLQEETDKIHRANSTFAVFLKHRAIVPYNDAYEAYLEYLIQQERNNVDVPSTEKLIRLEEYKEAYKQHKDSIENGASDSSLVTPNWKSLNLEYIETVVQELCKLKNYGEMIQTAVKNQNQFEKLKKSMEEKVSAVTQTAICSLSKSFTDILNSID